MQEDVEIGASTHLEGKFLTFALSSERYGLEILKVQEIIGITKITWVPKGPEYVRGVINLRGRIIPVVDLRLKLRMEEIPYDEKTCIIVVNVDCGDSRIAVGVIVDTVLEVVSYSGEEIQGSPNYGMQLDSSFILGIGKRDDLVSILLDIEKVISVEDKETISKLAS